MRPRGDQGAKYIPTPEQIEQATAEIRAKWTKRETRKRDQHKVQPVEPQRVSRCLSERIEESE